MVGMGADNVEVFRLVRLLRNANKRQDEAHLAFITDMLQRSDFNKETRDTTGKGLLHNAASGGRASLLAFLLDNGVNVNGLCVEGKKQTGASALCVAVESDKVENVRVLLDRGANVHLKSQSKGSISPLNTAAASGSEEIVELLLAKGANVNDKNNGRPVLHAVAPYARLNPIARLLLAHGALVNAADDKKKESALHGAVQGGNHELVKVLLDAGAVVDGTNRRALMHCALGVYKISTLSYAYPAFSSDPADDIKVVLLLLERGATLDYAHKDSGSTLLHYAARRGSPLICDFLVERGADVNAKAKDGRTPLHVAASNFHTEAATYLLDKGADVNGGVTGPGAAAAEGALLATATTTPLLDALKLTDEEEKRTYALLLDADAQRIVALSNLLLDRGCTIAGSTRNGALSTLHCAARTGDVGLVTRLLDMGAEVNAKAADGGESALHYAAKYRRADVVSLLIARGADVNAARDGGSTPLLQLAGLSVYDATLVNPTLAIATSLLDAGANVNVAPSTPVTSRVNAVLCALKVCNVNLVKLLLARGGDPTGVDANGCSALHRVCMRNNSSRINDTIDMLQLLISHGADPVVADKKGQRPSAYAYGTIKAFMLEQEETRMHNPGFKRACLTDLREPEPGPASSSSSSSAGVGGGVGGGSGSASASATAAAAGAVDTSDDDDDDDDDEEEG